ncbi:MAG TPA: ATP-grasp domain-containing protein [Bacteroidales bacterium]|nr:ATP-grasp domain-containing protein [Bacteroidales bacterium]
MPCSVHFKTLRREDLPELNNRHTLYTFDPRSILDECLGKHRYIVSCENLLSQILLNQHIAVNQYAFKLPFPERNELFVVPITGDPRPSLYRRMKDLVFPDEIEHLYACVPHPEADELAESLNLHLNCNHDDFLRYNDKIAQKTALGDLTPVWEIIDPRVHTYDDSEDCYYKRANGAGGYATFHNTDRKGMKMPSRKYPALWYKESTVEGEPCSVQIYRSSESEYRVFGYSEMRIVERKTYAGGRMRRIDALNQEIQIQIQEALSRLDSLFTGYHGFMGLDFIAFDNKIQLLEANVRVTMATFATLELNASDQQELSFYRFK